MKEFFAALLTILVVVLFAYTFLEPVRQVLIHTPISVLGEPLNAMFG